MIIVPVVLWVLQMKGLGGIEHAPHLAVGASFAIMVFTTFSSVMAQQRKGRVDWAVVRRMAPGVVVGVMIGSMLAKRLSMKLCRYFLLCLWCWWRSKPLTNAKPKPTRSLPGPAGLAAVGSLFGMASSWVGIGGGSLSVPFMLYCNVPVRTAVGTSAGLAWPIAVAGAVGYLYSGWNVAGLPEGTLGLHIAGGGGVERGHHAVAPLGVKDGTRLAARKSSTRFRLVAAGDCRAHAVWGLACCLSVSAFTEGHLKRLKKRACNHLPAIRLFDRKEQTMLKTTTPSVEGREIAAYLDIVVGEAILGSNFFKDMLGSIRDVVGGRSGAYSAKCVKRPRNRVCRNGSVYPEASAPIRMVGVDIDYEVIGQAAR